MPLTNIQCDKAPAGEKPYKLSDSGGLYLEVMPNGSKYWRCKYRYNKKERRAAFGVFPEITLAEARDKRANLKALLRNGLDPSLEKRKKKHLSRIKSDNTFEVLMRQWHEHKKGVWSKSYAQEVLNRMERDIVPSLGAYPITDISPPLILQTIRKIEKRGAYDIARRALQCVGQVFRYAIGEGKAQSDPTRDIRDQLKPVIKQHYACISYKQLPEFLEAMDNPEFMLYPQTRRAMKLMCLTFLRTSELIKAQWDEIDFNEKSWIIPKERMKGKKGQRREHFVPLSSQSIELLNAQKELTGQWQWVFPSQVRPAKHMSNNTILKALERIGYKGSMTGHGFRALARTTIRERLGYDREIIEKQLAHKTRETLGEAYDRTQFKDQRIEMMQAWADFLDALVNKDKVISYE